MKRTLLTLGTVAAVAAPIAGVVACSSTNKDETYTGSLGSKKLKILTLGDSVAHGDYTFQMSGSGTGFVPLLDGPARAASYQDFLFDEFKRDGLMDETTMPDYRTSASGLRSGELAQWLKPGSNYIAGQKADNPDFAITGSEDKKHVDYHRHPYTEGSTGKTWWDDGLKDDKGHQIDAHQSDVLADQKDTMTMDEHVKESDVVLITIGGNDILKDIMVMGTPFPSLGTINWETAIQKFMAEAKTSFSAYATKEKVNPAKIAEVMKLIFDPSFMTKAKGIIQGVKTQIDAGISKIDPTILITKALTTFKPILDAIANVPEPERILFNKWFMEEGHKSLITVDETKFKESLTKFYANIKLMSEEIHTTNPKAKVIFTGYPSPLMHFPKIVRNLAMPFYGQIAKLTEDYTKTDKDAYFAPSSLQNWETDDPTDIYDNILVDPHPTLEGQGAMAQDIIKVIDGIYGLNSKITDKELKDEVDDLVSAHSAKAPEYKTVAERNAAIHDGTYKYPYQQAVDSKLRGDLDYAYGVKPLPLEEIDHAKVYFGARIGMFLIDALTDSIMLNSEVKNPGDQSVPFTGSLTLSDFTVAWGEEYLKNHPDEAFIKPLGADFEDKFEKEFGESILKFVDTFANKLEGVLVSSDKVTKAKTILNLFE